MSKYFLFFLKINFEKNQAPGIMLQMAAKCYNFLDTNFVNYCLRSYDCTMVCPKESRCPRFKQGPLKQMDGIATKCKFANGH